MENLPHLVLFSPFDAFLLSRLRSVVIFLFSFPLPETAVVKKSYTRSTKKKKFTLKRRTQQAKVFFTENFLSFAGEAIIKRKTQESKSSRCFDIFRHAKKWRKMLFNSEFHCSLARPKTQKNFFTIRRSHFLLLLLFVSIPSAFVLITSPSHDFTIMCSKLSSHQIVSLFFHALNDHQKSTRNDKDFFFFTSSKRCSKGSTREISSSVPSRRRDRKELFE